ncbi:MAG TPA: hypothetical protein VFL96_03485 [Acidobacteriaceae bacterium]|nr:hypothetical protein [Acidobacteriaceae bacterium]
MHCGEAFLLFDDESFSGTPHLHIVIAEPDEAGQLVLVSITTRRAKSDTMVCLDAGDHPFITHPSVITYAYSKIITVTKLAEMVTSGDATPKERASDALVGRAQKGMLETDRAPREVQQLFRSIHGW